MLADHTGVISRGFGVLNEEDGLAYRGTFLVNPEGLSQGCWNPRQQHCRNAEELVRKVEAALYVASTMAKFALRSGRKMLRLSNPASTL